MKHTLVTGSAGFIGFHLSQKLLQKNHAVVGVDDLNPAYDSAIKKAHIAQLRKRRNFSFYQTDIRKKPDTASIFESHAIDCVVHLAARTGIRASVANPELYFDVNVNGTKNLYKLAQQHEVYRFIFASSSSVYGNSTNVPFSEEQKLPTPPSPYAASKQQAEKLLQRLHQKQPIPTTVLRFFSVYGPHGRPDMAPYIFTEKILNNEPLTQFGDGTTARDYTYVDDVIDGIICALNNPRPFETINIGNNHPIQLNTLITTIERITDKDAKRKVLPARAEESKKTWADIGKAQRLLGWRPQTDFQDGMKQFITWFRNNKRSSK